jgi:hypothetical protein
VARAAGPTSAALLVAVALGAGCGGSDGDQRGTQASAPPSTVAEPPDRNRPPTPGGAQSQTNPERGKGDGERESRTATEQVVQRAAVRYVEALGDADGNAVCSALVENALDEIELPRTRRDCATSLTASIGYRDPRGIPVFAGAELVALQGIEITANDARVTATVVTDFADRDEPSIEDDVIYLTRIDGAWRIAKASPTLYRAIGAADVPPNALAPPE